MTLVFYISGHGFGHAARALEVMRAILASHPDTHIVVRSSVPRWFLEAADLPGPQRTSPNGGDPRGRVEFQHVETDVGMVQIDSLRIDEDGTARVASTFYAAFSQRV